MDCKEVIKNMDKYFEDRLSDLEVHSIKKHLEKCDNCKLEYENTSRFFDIMSNHQPVLPPSDFTEKILAKVANHEKVISFKQNALKTWGLSFVAAGMMFVLCNVTDFNALNITNGLLRGTLEINYIFTSPLDKMSKSLKYYSDYFDIQNN